MTIKLPAVQSPIQMIVSQSALNGATQTPSAVAQATLNEDPKSLQVTWVGIGSDGAIHAGTSIPTGASEVADIGGGNLVITARAGGYLVFTQTAVRTAAKQNYVVTFIY